MEKMAWYTDTVIVGYLINIVYKGVHVEEI